MTARLGWRVGSVPGRPTVGLSSRSYGKYGQSASILVTQVAPGTGV